jgi:hypothetical protein
LATTIRNQLPLPVFGSGMSCVANLPVWLVPALALSLGADVLVAEPLQSPYMVIASRNVFGLMPPQFAGPEPPAAPLAKVDLLGVTTFGGTRALLRVHTPANPPEPAKQVACILSAGQRLGPITVLEIDAEAGTVKVDNAGTVSLLVFGRQPSPRPPPELPPLPHLKMTAR